MKPALFSHSDCSIARFGDVVHLNTDRIADPLTAGVERYVGLEHITPEDLHIHSWGLVADGTTFTNAFKPGQVLFGKRRAYQRKVAVADFSGVCSGDIYVFETRNPDVLLPELLPFICQTEGFYEHAVGTSAGSLSPRTNWNQLADYEFPLPPLEEQHKIITTLQAAEDVITSIETEILVLRTLKSSFIDAFFSSISETSVRTLGDLSLEKPKYGANAPACKYVSGNPRYIRITDIDEFGNLGTDLVSLKLENWNEYELEDGDFLFARTGATVGKTYLYKPSHGICVFAGYLVRFRLDRQMILPEFLFCFTKSPYYERWIKNTVHIGAQPNINAAEYAKLEVPVPKLKIQLKFIDQVTAIDNQVVGLSEHFRLSVLLKKQLLNEFLST